VLDVVELGELAAVVRRREALELLQHAALRGEVIWGPWRYNSDELSLDTHEEFPRYEIDLCTCTTSAAILNWITQIAKKPWADATTTAGIVNAFNDLLDLQASVCSSGVERGPIDVRELLDPAHCFPIR
jgi:hypothetical protein